MAFEAKLPKNPLTSPWICLASFRVYPYHLADLNFGCHYVSETRFQDVVLLLTRDKMRARLSFVATRTLSKLTVTSQKQKLLASAPSKNTFKKEEAADLPKICDVWRGASEGRVEAEPRKFGGTRALKPQNCRLFCSNVELLMNLRGSSAARLLSRGQLWK